MKLKVEAVHLLLTFILLIMKTTHIECKKLVATAKLWNHQLIILIFIYREYIKVSYPHLTKHETHVEKIPDVQIETVPVEKEIKVLVPYKVPYEVKVN
jgi:hypothetical protein